MGPIKKKLYNIRTENLGSNALYMKWHFILASKTQNCLHGNAHWLINIAGCTINGYKNIENIFKKFVMKINIFIDLKKKKNLGNVKMPTVTQHWKDFLQ